VIDPTFPPPPDDLPEFAIDAPGADSPEWSERVRVTPPAPPVSELAPPVVRLPMIVVPAGTTLPGRVRILWDAVRTLAEQLVEAAEEWIVLENGADRKAWTTAKLRALLRQLEAKVDLLPAAIERPVFWLLDRAAARLVEQAFRRLEAKGVVNLHRARPG
jgi:hypothetical protein